MHKEYRPFRPDERYIKSFGNSLNKSGTRLVDPFKMRHGKNPDKGRVLADTLGPQIDPRIYRQFAPLAIALALAATSTLCFSADTHAQQATNQMPDGTDIVEIHGGTPITESVAPYLVSMNYETPEQRLHLCGGAIIGPNAILTAAHCGSTFPGDEMASIEFTNITSPTEGLNWDKYKVPPDEVIVASPNKVITHQSYSTIPDVLYEGVDLAVVCTKEPITTDPDREQIALPDATTTITDALKANPVEQVAGWGYTGLMYGEGLPPDVANVTTFPTSHSLECQRKFRPLVRIVPFYEHCGGDGSFLDEATNDIPMTNGGDSGSPSVVKNPITGEDELFGVVSSRLSQFQMTFFTNAPGNTDFIQEAAEECKTHLGEPPPQDALDAKLTLTTQDSKIVPLGSKITVGIDAQTQTNQPVHGVELDAKISVFTCGPSTITPGAGYTATTPTNDNDLYSVTIKNEKDDSTMTGKVATVTLDTDHPDCAPGGDTFKPFEAKYVYVDLPGRLYIDLSKNTASSIRYRTPDDRAQEEIIFGDKKTDPQKFTVKPPVILDYMAASHLLDGQIVPLGTISYYNKGHYIDASLAGRHDGKNLLVDLGGVQGENKNGQLLLSLQDADGETRYGVLNLENGNGSVTFEDFFNSSSLFLPYVSGSKQE